MSPTVNLIAAGWWLASSPTNMMIEFHHSIGPGLTLVCEIDYYPSNHPRLRPCDPSPAIFRGSSAMKTNELIGAALDWAVAKCEGAYAPSVDTDIDGTKRINYGGMYPEWSTDWAQGGPIIEREKITIGKLDGQWLAFPDDLEKYAKFGPTHLIAAMRCYVASKLGDEVEIPEELCQ